METFIETYRTTIVVICSIVIFISFVKSFWLVYDYFREVIQKYKNKI